MDDFFSCMIRVHVHMYSHFIQLFCTIVTKIVVCTFVYMLHVATLQGTSY